MADPDRDEVGDFRTYDPESHDFRVGYSHGSSDTTINDVLPKERELEALRARLRAVEAERDRLREALREAVMRAVRGPNERYAYSRCNVCRQAWWDERRGEEHKRDCPVPQWRALASTGQEHHHAT